VSAYSIYRAAYVEHRELIRAASSSLSGRSLHLAMRGVAVLIVAEFEAYLRDLLQERVDAMTSSWDDATPGERRVIASTILARLDDLPQSLPDSGPQMDKQAQRVAVFMRTAGKWIDEPGEFARSGVRPSLEDLYDPSKIGDALNKIVRTLRADGIGFFDWLGSRGANQSLLKEGLGSLLSLRADAAHQNRQGLQPTPEELRIHQKRLGLLAWSVRSYLDAPAGHLVEPDP